MLAQCEVLPVVDEGDVWIPRSGKSDDDVAPAHPLPERCFQPLRDCPCNMSCRLKCCNARLGISQTYISCEAFRWQRYRL